MTKPKVFWAVLDKKGFLAPTLHWSGSGARNVCDKRNLNTPDRYYVKRVEVREIEAEEEKP